MTLHHPSPVFATPAGEFPATALTPTLLAALDAAQQHFCDGGHGEVPGNTARCNRLIRMGLAEKHGLGIRITPAGNRIVDRYLDQLHPAHKISYTHGSVPVAERDYTSPMDGRTVPSESMLFTAFCTCGWHHHGDEQSRRAAVRTHKQHHGIQ